MGLQVIGLVAPGSMKLRILGAVPSYSPNALIFNPSILASSSKTFIRDAFVFFAGYFF